MTKEDVEQILWQKIVDEERMMREEQEMKLRKLLEEDQKERYRLDRKCKELASSSEEMKLSVREMSLCQERVAFLERTLHTNRKEKAHTERELNDLKSDLSCKNMELSRLLTLNENFKTKLEELEAARDAVDKTDIEAKLDELRREKDGLETIVSETSQQRDRAEFELRKFKDEAATNKQELEYAVQERAEKISQLESKIGKLNEEKQKIMNEMGDLQNSTDRERIQFLEEELKRLKAKSDNSKCKCKRTAKLKANREFKRYARK